MPCHYRELAVAFLPLAVTFTGRFRAGFDVNADDFAPKFAGIVYGISNTAEAIPRMVVSIAAGALTPNKTQVEWRNVFYVCGALDVVCIFVLRFFGKGELEDWAEDAPKPSKKEIKDPRVKSECNRRSKAIDR